MEHTPRCAVQLAHNDQEDVVTIASDVFLTEEESSRACNGYSATSQMRSTSWQPRNAIVFLSCILIAQTAERSLQNRITGCLKGEFDPIPSRICNRPLLGTKTTQPLAPIATRGSTAGGTAHREQSAGVFQKTLTPTSSLASFLHTLTTIALFTTGIRERAVNNSKERARKSRW